MIRVGIEGLRRPVLDAVRSLNAPVLVSANSLWDDGRQRFRRTWEAYRGLDVALDSGGFVAMHRYGRFRYSAEQYVGLVKQMAPTWWAQMDLCCEPEIAQDRPAVLRRIDQTAVYLQKCQSVAREAGVPAPMLVLQGWKPIDYCSGPIYEQDYAWPELVGVGSVCRRQVGGPDGLLSVVAALDEALPPHVRLHLFGVKGAALRHLRNHRRFASVDSMAWNYNAQKVAWAEGLPCSNEFRAQRLRVWYDRQMTHEPDNQMQLL